MTSINRGIISSLPHAAMREFVLEVQRGKVPGCSVISKFAENPSIASATPADIWDYPTEALYIYSSGADIDSISSDNIGDAVLIVIQGLDANWQDVTQTAMLNGQNRVPLDIPLRRVYRAFNANGINLLGNIYIYEETPLGAGIPIDTTKVRGYIAVAEQQTLMGVYTVPAGKTGYFLGLTASISRVPAATGVVFTGRARIFERVFTTQIRFFLTSTGTSNVIQAATAFSPFPEKTDFSALADVDTNATGVSVTFDLLLIDNDLT